MPRGNSPQTLPTQSPVIPSASLVASAVRYSGSSARLWNPSKDWQAECYRHFRICSLARYAANLYGNALSRSKLTISKPGPDGPVVQKEGEAVDLLAELFNGTEGQAQMLKSIGIHLTVAGECYLVGRSTPVPDLDGEDETEEEIWEVVSVIEMQVSGEKWTINYGNTMTPIELTDTDVVIRIWEPDPANKMVADSPFRALLPVLAEIEWLTKHVEAQVTSRLTGPGLLFLPQGMTFPKPPDTDQVPTDLASQAGLFLQYLGEQLIEPIKKPGTPSATLPAVVLVPDDFVDKQNLMHFWSPLDENSMAMRQDAYRRFAIGMDLPPEEVLGMSSNTGTGGGSSNGVSHWGAWQIEESTIKMHIETKLEVIVNALTVSYIRPMIDTDEIVTYDTSSLRLRPDRSKEALELHARGALKTTRMLEENGFDASDMPDDDEQRMWLIRKVASGSATPEQVGAALKLLGIDLGVQTSEPTPQLPREARPEPSLEDHPTRPRTPDESAVLAASDALVWRALERSGNRIRQMSGVKPPGVKSYEMHTVHPVNGEAAAVLDDAWSCAPQVLEGLCNPDEQVAVLDSYVRSLFAQQAPHTREALKKWMERVR